MYQVIFKSASVRKAVETARKVAPRTAPVLITGESGTGKEVLANIIHQASGRPGPFVPVNCAALPSELVESELFGSAKGSYTGAHQDRDGLVTQASNGTLFLDELSELPGAMQAKLLRVLQERKVRPIGRNTEQPVDFRLITAMSADPHALVQEKKLRLDLFYRISVVSIRMPPLRQRPEDVLPLATTFLAHYAAENGVPSPTLSEEAIGFLKGHSWPGNIRQLQNEMQRAVALHEGELKTEDFSEELLRVNAVTELVQDGTLHAHERQVILETLIKCGGNRSLTAETLGIARHTLLDKVRRYGLDSWGRTSQQRRHIKVSPRLLRSLSLARQEAK